MGSNPKTTVYVGGLEESVNEAILHAAFVPFGDVKDVNIPLDQGTQKNRGFGFVTFVERDDAASAMDNMHEAELYGRVLTVNYAQPMKIKGGEQGWASQPVWADADTWFDRQQQEEEIKKLQAEHNETVQKAREEGEGQGDVEGEEASGAKEGGGEEGGRADKGSTEMSEDTPGAHATVHVADPMAAAEKEAMIEAQGAK